MCTIHLDYILQQDLYQSQTRYRTEGAGNGGLVLNDASQNGRTEVYKDILTRVRHVLIMRMSKPEEVSATAYCVQHVFMM
jgi:hypothetical protein